MLNDGAHAYAYNAESEIKSAAGVNYTGVYPERSRRNGDGNRVEKSSGKAYWYGAGTEILDESDLSGNITNEYVFFGGKRIAMRNVSSGTIYHYEDDMLGSARTMVQAGQTSPCYDGDFYPFGGERIITNTCTQNYKFEGKERDTETGNDDFGARYNSSRLGRFMSPDPVTATPLHIINPQRWNMYAYGMNNPLSYVDPDGRDAIAVNFVGEVPLGGHEGIIVVHSDGSATYARFGPMHANTPSDEGKVTIQSLKPVKFGPDGLPTDASYKELAAEVAKTEGQPASTVGFNYFKTSDADTIALQNWIDGWNTAHAPDYDVLSSNCAAFCIAGLLVGRAIENRNVSLIPNRLFMLLSSVADENWTWQGRQDNREPKHKRPKVAPCLKRRDGSCVDQ